MTQGGSPGRLLHQSGCGGLFFCVRGRNPVEQGGSLPYFIAYCHKNEDFEPKISLSFPIANVGGGGGNNKNEKHSQ